MAAIVVGDRVIYRGTFSSNIFGTNLLPTPPQMGWVYAVAAPVCSVQWNNGKQSLSLQMNTATPDAIPILKIAANPSSAALLGQVVRSTVNSQSAAFVGLVYSLLGIQLIPDGASEVYDDHGIVRTPGGLYWIAPVSELAVVPGR